MSSDCCKMICKTGANVAACSLSILVGTWSSPVAFLGLSEASSFSTPATVTLISGITGKGLGPFDGMESASSLVKTELYWLDKASAFSFAVVTTWFSETEEAMPMLFLFKDLTYFHSLLDPFSTSSNIYRWWNLYAMHLFSAWFHPEVQCTSSNFLASCTSCSHRTAASFASKGVLFLASSRVNPIYLSSVWYAHSCLQCSQSVVWSRTNSRM